MAKHRLEQPSRGGKIAKTAVIAGSLTAGTLAITAGPALAAPAPAKAPSATVEIPNLGKFQLPGISDRQVPEQFKPKNLPNLLQPQNTTGQKAVAAAESRIGSPYVWGATGPNAFDCSGLTKWAFQQAGKSIPRDSYGQLGGGSAVSGIGNARPGDILVFDGGSHVGLYIGGGQFVHASTEGVPVKKDNVSNWDVTAIRRY